MYKRYIQDGDEYNALTHRLTEIGYLLMNGYVEDKADLEQNLDEIQANVVKLRELLELPETDKPDNLDASPFLHNTGNKSDFQSNTDEWENQLIPEKSDNKPEKGSIKNLRAVRSNGTFVEKGDKVDSFRQEEWTFQSVTHPRKVHVTDKNDPNGPDSHPNMASREFYANVFNLGIWDLQYKEWTSVPSWPERDIDTVEHNLRNLSFEH